MSLTKKQKQVYDYICEYIDQNSFSPTQMEIKEHFGFKSLGSVQDYIRYLKNSGHLQNDPNSVRGLRPTEELSSTENAIEIPLHGKVAAGNPIEAFEGSESIGIPASLLTSSGNHFALTVSGESMIEDGILDGDVIIVKERHTANNGETIIATINNEATVKRYYKKSNQIELHPANSSMSPIIIRDGDFHIKGILVGLYRSY